MAAELKRWKPLPALVRHSATAAGLTTLFLSYGNLAGRRSAVSLLAVMLALCASALADTEEAYDRRLADLARALEGEPRNAALASVFEAERVRVRADPAVGRP